MHLDIGLSSTFNRTRNDVAVVGILTSRRLRGNLNSAHVPPGGESHHNDLSAPYSMAWLNGGKLLEGGLQLCLRRCGNYLSLPSVHVCVCECVCVRLNHSALYRTDTHVRIREEELDA